MATAQAMSFTTPSGVVVNEEGQILSIPFSMVAQFKKPTVKTTCTSLAWVCLKLSVNQSKQYANTHPTN